MVIALQVVITLILGFLGGLTLFKVKSRWCRDCGGPLVCPDWLHHVRQVDANHEGFSRD